LPKLNKDIIEEFYFLTLIDIRDGVSLQDLEKIIKLYEEMEDYEACAGILKAINETKYYTLNNLNNGDTKEHRTDGE